MGGQVIAMHIDGVDVLVEASPSAGTEPTSVGSRAQQQVIDAFARAQDAIVAVSSTTASTVRRLAAKNARPNKVEVEFGLKFTAKGDVIVASGSTEVALKVTIGYDSARGATTRRADEAEDDDDDERRTADLNP
jgi:hypothetical protein